LEWWVIVKLSISGLRLGFFIQSRATTDFDGLGEPAPSYDQLAAVSKVKGAVAVCGEHVED
jgi:hypothetical protein